MLDGSLAVIRGRGELFERGGQMVRVAAAVFASWTIIG